MIELKFKNGKVFKINLTMIEAIIMLVLGIMALLKGNLELGTICWAMSEVLSLADDNRALKEDIKDLKKRLDK